MLPNEFWKLTLAEFLIMSEGYQRKQIDRAKEIIVLSWNIANFTNAKELPKLDELLDRIDNNSKPKQEQTDDDMLAMVKILNSAYGGEVVEV